MTHSCHLITLSTNQSGRVRGDVMAITDELIDDAG